MTITSQITIWCDGCGNWRQFSTSKVRLAVAEAKKHHWCVKKVDDRIKHYCNDCVVAGAVPAGGR